MRMIFIIAVIILMALGCNKKDGQGTSKLPKSRAASGQEADTAHELKKAPDAETDNSTNRRTLDPVFKDYEYPASTVEDKFSVSNVVSVIYKSPDDFSKVVEFYKHKFPDAPPQSGTTVYFGKEIEDGSSFTVTVTQLENNTQIILKLEKKI